MVAIVGYTYDGDDHCPHDTLLDYTNGVIRTKPGVPVEFDEHGLPESLIDRLDNPVHPVFDTDEDAARFDHCG